MSENSFRFSHAITRKPAASIIAGLRAVDIGTPDLALMQAHHADYIAALKSTGAQVIELDALSDYPDSVFVEDTALCLPQGAVVMRPGAPSRLGEAAEMAPHLAALYRQVVTISGSAAREAIRKQEELPQWYMHEIVQESLRSSVARGEAVFCE